MAAGWFTYRNANHYHNVIIVKYSNSLPRWFSLGEAMSYHPIMISSTHCKNPATRAGRGGEQELQSSVKNLAAELFWFILKTSVCIETSFTLVVHDWTSSKWFWPKDLK